MIPFHSIPFHSIPLAIADLIDTGSSIVVSGRKSFHGFLTPDNIIIDYDGKIFLKNYGIFPYLNQDDVIFSEMVKKYGAWIAPEFLRKERPIPQSDIYHLGYIIYRMLTGNYFSCLPDEDFDAKFSNISFTAHIDSSDTDFLTNIINFFKKTLNPDPTKRFANIREFRDFIAGHFKIEELSSVTFSLAYFMNSLYAEISEEENKELETELAYKVPFKSEEQKKTDDALIENILIGLEEKEKAKSKFVLFSVIITVVAIAVAAYFFITMNKSRQAEIARYEQLKKEYEASKQQLASTEGKYQEQIKNIQDQIATTEEEKQARQEEVERLKKEYQEEKRKELEKQKQLQAKIKEEITTDQPGDKPEETPAEKPVVTPGEAGETTVPVEEDTGKTAGDTPPVVTAPPATAAGQLIPLSDATVKPAQISGKKPGQGYVLRKKYAGRRVNILTSILVNENGEVEKIRVLGSVPGDIKDNILKTVKKWKFKPAQKDGVNVKVWLQRRFNIQFKKF